MLTIRRARVQLLLVIVAINLVVSCLVTNCPRGGKRGWSGLVTGDVVNHEAKKCKLCTEKKGMCIEKVCSLSTDCEDEGVCVTTEVCCSKGYCKMDKSCKADHPMPSFKGFKPRSVILGKILSFSLNHSRQFYEVQGN